MKIKRVFLLMTIFLVFSGCSQSINGTVVDAETGAPIESAVVLVEWTKTSGKWIGMRATKSYKVFEVLTHRNGKFEVSGFVSTFANPPRITIYKKGYVAWNSELVFPGSKKRKKQDWPAQNSIGIKLKHFDESKNTYTDHVLFIHGCINYGLQGSKKPKIERAIRWEQLKAVKERQKLK